MFLVALCGLTIMGCGFYEMILSYGGHDTYLLILGYLLLRVGMAVIKIVIKICE